jgi:hypothetical protein
VTLKNRVFLILVSVIGFSLSLQAEAKMNTCVKEGARFDFKWLASGKVKVEKIYQSDWGEVRLKCTAVPLKNSQSESYECYMPYNTAGYDFNFAFKLLKGQRTVIVSQKLMSGDPLVLPCFEPAK